jgi:hypothetical protein
MLASSSIVQDIIAMQKAGLASLAFFYCDFREDQKKDLRGLLSSLIVQLSHQSDSYSDTLFKFYSEHGEGSRDPSDDELARCLTDLLKIPGHAPVYVIVDALDECPNTSAVRSPRAKVLNLIQELIKSECPNLRICVTSRPETDIKDVLNTLTFRTAALFPCMTRADKRETLRTTSSRSFTRIRRIEDGKRSTSNWSSTSSQKRPTACKASIQDP